MWILHWLPDSFLLFIVNTILIVGVVSTILTFFVLNRLLRLFPVLANYHLLLQVASVVILATGVYLKGSYSTEMEWRARVAEVEKQLEEAKKESGKVNTVVETKVVTKTKVIKEKGETIIKEVDKIIPVEKDCTVPKEAVDVHNEAARMNKAIEELRKGEKK